MKKVIIVGAGAHAAELNDYIHHDIRYRNNSNSIEVTGFIDDDQEIYNNYQFEAPFLGSILDHHPLQDVYYLIGIAKLESRKNIVFSLQAKGAKFISFVHPDAYISRSASIGKGTVIAPNVNLGPNTSIGKFSLINSRCSIGHDTELGAFNLISPNVSLSGHTNVGDENLFGINSATIPGIKVGSRNKIMAGMIVDKPVGDDEVIFYRFKEKVIAISK